MSPSVEALPDGIRAIDTMTAGLTKVTAGYLIDAPRPTLVECGPALSVANVVAALAGLGMEASDLAYLVLSHIHLDHAGGAGDVATAFPGATVVVSEVGAPHLVAPERLNASSRRVYGDLMDTVYGDCTPIDAHRVRGVADGERLDLGGGRYLDLLFTPGHAKHHIAAFDADAGALFVGDSVGVKMPGMAQIRPATPPPDFDMTLATRTLRRYVDLDPAVVYLAHYGPLDPPQASLQEAERRLRQWFESAERAYRAAPTRDGHSEVDHVTETLAQRFTDELIDDELVADTADGDLAGRLSLLSGYRSNAMGLVRYLQLRDDGEQEPDP